MLQPRLTFCCGVQVRLQVSVRGRKDPLPLWRCELPRVHELASELPSMVSTPLCVSWRQQNCLGKPLKTLSSCGDECCVTSLVALNQRSGGARLCIFCQVCRKHNCCTHCQHVPCSSTISAMAGGPSAKLKKHTIFPKCMCHGRPCSANELRFRTAAHRRKKKKILILCARVSARSAPVRLSRTVSDSGQLKKTIHAQQCNDIKMYARKRAK